MRYFKITEQSEDDPPRWHLSPLLLPNGEEITPGMFASRAKTDDVSGELRTFIQEDWPGRRVRFTFGYFDVPILDEELALAVAALCPDDVQLLPVKIQSVRDRHYAVNVFRSMPCVDEGRTYVMRWTREEAEEDGQPEKAGTYRMVAHMDIDPSRVGDAKLFRPAEWPVALVCSEDVRDLLLKHAVTGVSFAAVSWAFTPARQ